MYYVHHVRHGAFRRVTSARVEVKPFHAAAKETYEFTDVIWESEEYEWTGVCPTDERLEKHPCSDFVYYGAILSDSDAAGFVRRRFLDAFSFKDYYEEETQLFEERHFLSKVAYREGERLTLINQWCVFSFSSKDEEPAEDESMEMHYEDLRTMNCVGEVVYQGELLQYARITIGGKGYFVCDDASGVWTMDENYKEKATDYLEYCVTFS